MVHVDDSCWDVFGNDDSGDDNASGDKIDPQRCPDKKEAVTSNNGSNSVEQTQKNNACWDVFGDDSDSDDDGVDQHHNGLNGSPSANANINNQHSNGPSEPQKDSCWDVFGDDSDDDDDGDDDDGDMNQQHTALNNSCSANASVDVNHLSTCPGAEEALDATVLHLTKRFLQTNPSLGLSKRFVSISQQHLGKPYQHQPSVVCEMAQRALSSRGMQVIPYPKIDLNSSARLDCCDAFITVLCDSSHSHGNDEGVSLRWSQMNKRVVPGGVMILLFPPSNEQPQQPQTISNTNDAVANTMQYFHPNLWSIETKEWLTSRHENGPTWRALSITKREGLINHWSCPWKGSKAPSRNDKNSNIDPMLSYERQIISQVTIPPTAYTLRSTSTTPEHQKCKSLPPEHIQKAVNALSKFGFCILRRLYPPGIIQPYAKAVLSDLQSAIQVLRKRNIELLEPGLGEREPLSHRELAMREDLRVDLRYGPALHDLLYPQSSDKYICPIANHPTILEILSQVFSPKGRHYRGNYGRWNFNGDGPDGSPQPISVGRVGSVITMPNCGDQAIHADTPHLFEHLDLAPHYIDLFINATDTQTLSNDNVNDNGRNDSTDHEEDEDEFNGDSHVGGTAFLAGTHKLEICAMCMPEHENGRSRTEKLKRIIRPSLEPGDALLFDCRILHFGLANNSQQLDVVCPSNTHRRHSRGGSIPKNNSTTPTNAAGVCRPMLYINYTQEWFSDPKNWDDRDSLFPELYNDRL